jgi:predicted enzyme related to lactoylglutathione lyase
VSRVQLALNVSNLEQAIEFYSKFFKSEPAKVRPGYANFAIEEPPLKLVLIENEGEPGSLNHLGVEVFSTDEVQESTKYLSEVGLTTRVKNTPPVVSRCRTRCGWTVSTGPDGRCTPCSRTR